MSEGIDFTLKGHEGRVIQGAHAHGALKITGVFYFQGSQPINKSGGAPEWVADFFDLHPKIDQVALSGEEGSVVWSRIKG